MKAEDLKTKTPDELKKLLFEQRKAQFNMRFQRSQGALENTAEIRKTRRMIARIKTFLNMDGKPAAPKPPAKKAAPKKTEAKDTGAKKKAPAKKTSEKAA